MLLCAHEASHRFAIVRHPLPLMLVHRLLAFVAKKDAGTRDILREWHDGLVYLKSTRSNESSEPEYHGGEEEESDEDPSHTDHLEHDVTPASSEGAVQDEAVLVAEGPFAEGTFNYSEDMAYRRHLISSADSQPGDATGDPTKLEDDDGNDECDIDDHDHVQTFGAQQDIVTAETEGKPDNTRIGVRTPLRYLQSLVKWETIPDP